MLSDIPIEELHLPFRSSAFLRRLGIGTIGHLVNRLGIAGVHKSQPAISDEIIRAMSSLLGAASVDWQHYRSLYIAGSTVPILPSRHRATWTSDDFVRDLPRAAREMVRLQFTAQHLVVLRHRIFKKDQSQYSLGDLACELKVSRERIHSIEKRILDVLRSSLLRSEYRRCRFRFHPEFARPLEVLARSLRSTKSLGLMGAESWKAVVRRVWGMDVTDLGIAGPLIEKLVGVKLAAANGQGLRQVRRIALRRKRTSPKRLIY